jgi:hypothetical protein
LEKPLTRIVLNPATALINPINGQNLADQSGTQLTLGYVVTSTLFNINDPALKPQQKLDYYIFAKGFTEPKVVDEATAQTLANLVLSSNNVMLGGAAYDVIVAATNAAKLEEQMELNRAVDAEAQASFESAHSQPESEEPAEDPAPIDPVIDPLPV